MAGRVVDVGVVDVGVVVDLVWSDNAGGHVKCWENFARAAVGFADRLSLTLYVLGPAARTVELSETVRYCVLPARLGTDRFAMLTQGAGHTDLAGHHPELARRLRHHQVLQATSVFAFAQTARTVARRHRLPLIYSSHTDYRVLTAVYTREIIARVLGTGVVARLLVGPLGVAERAGRAAERRCRRFQAGCDHVLVSGPKEYAEAAQVVAPGRLSRLRRGIDKTRFSPARRRPGWLADQFGVPDRVPVILFAGRVDDSKRATLVAEAVRRLLDDGVACHLLVAGTGAAVPAIRALLGPAVTLAGPISQDCLAEVFANADVFAFPSESEVVGNVVIEAKASGLPVIVSATGKTAEQIFADGADGLLLHDRSAAGLAELLRALIADPARRHALGAAARRSIEERWPSWGDVLAEDLLPVWQRLGGIAAPAVAA